MAVVVDTETAPPRERFDLWTEASLQVFEPIAVELRDESQRAPTRRSPPGSCATSSAR